VVADSALRPLLIRRLRPAHLIACDAVVALGLALLCMLAALDPPQPDGFQGPLWLAWLMAAGIGLPVAVRRRWPLAALGGTLVASNAAVLLGMIWVPYLGTALVLYLVALTTPRGRSVPALLICLLSAAGASLIIASTSYTPYAADALGGAAFSWLVMGVAWLAGLAARERRAYTAQAAAHLARQAVTEERLRIAREMHDVVAHSMSVIAVKAGIANHVADARPEEARDALRVIEVTSRGALAEMRRTLGVLRSDVDGVAHSATRGDLEPVRGMADLPALAERAALTGVRVDLDVRGLAELPEGVGLSVYRIVQEALTNVVKHAAPAHCRVAVEADRHEVRIEVTDDGPGGSVLQNPSDASGHGLLGMRERVMMYHGVFVAGPRPEGGFGVTARLPYASSGLAA
jgi:signal transduction histidine kinase